MRILVLEGKLESINVAGTRRLISNYVRSRLADSTPGPLNEQRMRSDLQLQQTSPEVTNISNVWTNSGPRATLEANTLLSAGLGWRWQYGQRWNARGGGGIPLIGLKSSDRSWQQGGVYFSVEFKPF